MTSYGEEYDASIWADIEDFFTSYDITYTVDVSNIYYYGVNEAAIYVENKEKEANEAETYEHGEIYILSKSDIGSWTIDDYYSVFSKLSK